MKTVALRFANKFAPECGTIEAHNDLIKQNGYVWYGKLGNKIAGSIFPEILDNEPSRILLIYSGSTGRYWAYVDKIQHKIPELSEVPEYYRDMADKFKTWFRVIRFEDAPKGLMGKCIVASSGATLSDDSKHSISPYFKIIAPDD